MRKPAFCTCQNKDADQLRRYREADLHLCFRIGNFPQKSGFLLTWLNYIPVSGIFLSSASKSRLLL